MSVTGRLQKSIRMRVNKDGSGKCKVCGASRDNVLELFDISFTPIHIITICDSCNERLFNATLKATCMVNNKLKSPQDIAIINARRRRKELMKHG